MSAESTDCWFRQYGCKYNCNYKRKHHYSFGQHSPPVNVKVIMESHAMLRAAACTDTLLITGY